MRRLSSLAVARGLRVRSVVIEARPEGMILTCPQCETRYQADASKFLPAGRNVRCAKCSHVWHQDAPAAEPDAASEVVIDDTPEPAAPPPPAAAPVPPPVSPNSPPRAQAFAPNPIITRETAPAAVVPRASHSPWPGRLALGAGWVALVLIVLAIGWSAFAFRQQIATVWPQSAALYNAVGVKTNAGGIDIQNVSFKRAPENGQLVLAVSGLLNNTTARELPVPQIRVALIDNDRHELYHWTFVPGVMTLKPGQTAPFLTRLSNPPAEASHYELRFAKADE
jgi:predicted Zn finger-like uncharacterized protein